MRLYIDPKSLRGVAKQLRVTGDGLGAQAKAIRLDQLPVGLSPTDVNFIRDRVTDISRGLDRLSTRFDRDAAELGRRAEKAEEFHQNLQQLKLTLPVIQPAKGNKRYQPFRGRLVLGDEGPQVAELQRRLRAAGFRPGPPDGKFGAATQAAVKAFQKAQGLALTGIVGKKTAEALGLQGQRPGDSANTGAESRSGYVWPTLSRVVTAPWAEWRDNGRRQHAGIDIAAPGGAKIVAAKAGVVSHAGSYDGYGNTVDIRHSDGLISRYAHQRRVAVRSGQRVEIREVIGYVGNTGHSFGDHLHFEIRSPGFGFGGTQNPLAKLGNK